MSKEGTIRVAAIQEAIAELASSNEVLRTLPEMGGAGVPEELAAQIRAHAAQMRAANQELRESISECVLAGEIR